MTRRAQAVGLWAPRVRFAPDFPRRLEAFAARAQVARERREGGARSALVGAGVEFAGYRPYRPGDDPRRIDWDLMARLDRPYVRIARAEVSSTWTVLVDASASMGVGEPGKLQRAAEIAAALAASALRAGATVRVQASARPELPLEIARIARLGDLLAFLESLEAQGTQGLAALCARADAGPRGVLVALGDGMDLEPEAFAALARPGRALAAGLVLAPHELAPPEGAPALLVDPESGEELAVARDPATAARYRRALEERLERWAAALARSRAAFAVRASAAPFEELAGALLGL